MVSNFENNAITFLHRNEPIKCPETISRGAGAEGNRKGLSGNFSPRSLPAPKARGGPSLEKEAVLPPCGQGTVQPLPGTAAGYVAAELGKGEGQE